jgi:hypothetical protein
MMTEPQTPPTKNLPTTGLTKGESPAVGSSGAGSGIDPRGPRFGAALTSVVLAIALLTGNVWVLAAQVVIFALGSLLGLSYSPYGYLFRVFVRPRLSPPSELEDEAPPRFAQTVGLAVTGVGLALTVAGVGAAVEVSAAIALIAAVLNAVFGLCLGCEMYLLLARLRSPRPAAG